MPIQNLSDIGPRGLVTTFDGDKYYYVSEDDWRQNGPLTDPKAAGIPVADLAKLKVVVTQLNGGAFVNLDRLAGLAKDPTASQNGNPIAWRQSSVNIVLEENGKCFQITREDMKDLPTGFEGDARVVVKRGAVVASIPPNTIPSGTYCVLVNLASLK